MSKWLDTGKIDFYLNVIHPAIPFYPEMLDQMISLIGPLGKKSFRFVDLGAGNGPITQKVLDEFPDSTGTLLDFNPEMVRFLNEQFGNRDTITIQNQKIEEWDPTPCDVVVSGLAIHHLTDEDKQECYQKIFSALTPPGLFLNLDLVTLNGFLIQELSHQDFLDRVYSKAVEKDETMDRQSFQKLSDKYIDIHEDTLTDLDTQLHWLRTLGFQQVDVFFKYYKFALFGGFKLP